MSAHTPGPWRTRGTEVFAIDRDDGDPVAVAQCTGKLMFASTVYTSPKSIELQANARLIAAAPIGYELAALIERLSSSPMSRDFVPPEVQLLAREFMKAVKP